MMEKKICVGSVGLLDLANNYLRLVSLTKLMCSFVYLNEEIFCGYFFESVGPKGVINDWRRFKLDSVDQTVPQSKRELLRQMSSPREDDKERLNRKV